MEGRESIDADPRGWLTSLLADFDCETGTLHRAEGAWLALVAAVGVPDALLPVVERIPFGKGIAGAAAERREPVELCNLQQDLGGVAREGARQTQVSGSLAVPVLAAADGAVLGTLGIGKRVPYEFTNEEKERLGRIASAIAEHWR